MKNLLQHLLSYTLILFTLSIAMPAFGQDGSDGDGPPSIRKEASDGRNDCHLYNTGSDHNLKITVSFSDPSYLDCDMHIGYRHIGQDYVYAPVVPKSDDNGGYSKTIIIPFSAVDIAYRCESGIFGFRIGLYCLVDGQYVPILNDNSPDNEPLIICCDDDEPTEAGLPNSDGPVDSPGIPFKTNSDTDIFEYNETKNLGEKEIVDYNLYDLHGNHIKTVKSVSPTNGVQEIVSGLSIRSGFYFVRYMENGKIQTKKVFKF